MQKNKKRNVRRRGFTLIELLIVIVIIGIMSSMMMITTGSATDKAEATRIVSDLRNIQSASVLYFADEESWPTGDIKLINPYLSAKLEEESKYSLVSGTNGSLHAQYKNDDIASGVLEKLDDMRAKGAPISVDAAQKTVELVIRN